MKFVKGLRHVPYEAALQWLKLFSLTRKRMRGDLIYMFKIMHDLLDFPCDTVFDAPSRIGLRGHTFKILSTVVEDPSPPTCVQRSSSPVPEEIVTPLTRPPILPPKLVPPCRIPSYAISVIILGRL